MLKLKKITFYYNRNRYEGFSRIVRIDTIENLSNTEIVEKVLGSVSAPADIEELHFSDNSFYNSFDGIVTDFEIEDLQIIDLAIKE